LAMRGQHGKKRGVGDRKKTGERTKFYTFCLKGEGERRQKPKENQAERGGCSHNWVKRSEIKIKGGGLKTKQKKAHKSAAVSTAVTCGMQGLLK